MTRTRRPFRTIRRGVPRLARPRPGAPARGSGGANFYVLSRFEDIWNTVRRPDVSSASGITFRNEPAELGLAPTIVMLDPPVHTRLRGLIGSAFTPTRVTRLEDELRAFVRSRIDLMERKAADGEPVDLHRDFSSPIPTFVLGSLLGIPENERAGSTRGSPGWSGCRTPASRWTGSADARRLGGRDVRLLQRRDQGPPRASRATTCSARWWPPRSTASGSATGTSSASASSWWPAATTRPAT